MRTVQSIEPSVIGTKVDSRANDHRRGHQGAGGLKLPQPFARQGMPGIQIAVGVTDIEGLGGHGWCRDNSTGRFPRGKTPPAAGLDGWPRHWELPDPELGPDQLQLILPGDLTSIGCHSVDLTSRGEIDQPVGDDRRVLQTVSGCENAAGSARSWHAERTASPP